MDKFEEIESRLRRAFTPASPIAHAHRLQGRSGLLDDLRRAWNREGASVVLYGRRGVGKTSLVTVASNTFRGPVFYHSASADDRFSSIASAMLHHLGRPGGGSGPASSSSTLLTPQDVVRFLPPNPCLVVIDDFERLRSRDTTFAFADLVKKISDARISTTLTFVGIGDHAGELIEGHRSAKRQLISLEVPPLTGTSIENIIQVGAEKLGIRFEPVAIDRIATLSENVPYCAHLLSECAVYSLLGSIRRGERSEPLVTLREVGAALEYARQSRQYPVLTDDHAVWPRIEHQQTGS